MTIYKDKLAARREIDLRDQQYQRDRRPVGRWFPGSGLLACSSMGDPKGWSEAVLQLELSRARVLDQQLRDMADQVRSIAGDAIWASSLAKARQLSERLEPLQIRFNEAVTQIISSYF